ncbi:MAG: LptE family protein [Tepidisphaeraceae bacterium]
MTPLARHARFVTIGLLVLAASGCGYSNSSSPGYTWGTTFRQDVRTIALPVFTTKSFYRGDELRLTQALSNQIESRTPYKVVDRTSADTILEGQIVKVDVGTVSQDPINALPQEQLYTITIDFTWKDLRTGQILVERRGFEQTVTYYPGLGDGRFTGSQQAAEQLAAGIVDELTANW